MNYSKAIVIANKTSEGLSVIDISLYDETGRRCNWATKRLIDKINETPLLNKEKIKFMVFRQYGIRTNNVIFN